MIFLMIITCNIFKKINSLKVHCFQNLFLFLPVVTCQSDKRVVPKSRNSLRQCGGKKVYVKLAAKAANEKQNYCWPSWPLMVSFDFSLGYPGTWSRAIVANGRAQRIADFTPRIKVPIQRIQFALVFVCL